MGNLLFGSGTWPSFFEQRREKVQEHIRRLSLKDFNRTDGDLAEEICQKLALEVPAIQRDQMERSEPKEDATGNSIIEIFVPFSGDRDFFDIRPERSFRNRLDSYAMSPPEADIRGNNLVFRLPARSGLSENLESTLEIVESCLSAHKNKYASFPGEFQQFVQDQIAGRRRQLQEEKRALAEFDAKKKT